MPGVTWKSFVVCQSPWLLSYPGPRSASATTWTFALEPVGASSRSMSLEMKSSRLLSPDMETMTVHFACAAGAPAALPASTATIPSIRKIGTTMRIVRSMVESPLATTDAPARRHVVTGQRSLVAYGVDHPNGSS
jgi:hypothetical protein